MTMSDGANEGQKYVIDCSIVAVNNKHWLGESEAETKGQSPSSCMLG
jgi:hypothetical protein